MRYPNSIATIVLVFLVANNASDQKAVGQGPAVQTTSSTNDFVDFSGEWRSDRMWFALQQSPDGTVTGRYGRPHQTQVGAVRGSAAGNQLSLKYRTPDGKGISEWTLNGASSAIIRWKQENSLAPGWDGEYEVTRFETSPPEEISGEMDSEPEPVEIPIEPTVEPQETDTVASPTEEAAPSTSSDDDALFGDSDFTVSFPTEPELKSIGEINDDGSGMIVDEWQSESVLPLSKTTFQVLDASFGDHHPASNFSAEQHFENILEFFLVDIDQSEVHQASNIPVTIQGFPGMLREFSAVKGSVGFKINELTIVVDSKHVYSVGVLRVFPADDQSHTSDGQAIAFIDSFKLKQSAENVEIPDETNEHQESENDQDLNGSDEEWIEASDIEENPSGSGESSASELLDQAIGYFNGTSGQVDQPKAVELLHQAAAQNDPLAKMWLAIIYETEAVYGIGWDTELAARLASESIDDVKQMATQSESEAMWLFAFALDWGLGVDKDPEAARRWLRRSAEAGSSNGQNFFGDRLLFKEQDRSGIQWLRRAADQGNVCALGELAWYLIQENGGKGDSIAMLRKAAEHGYPRSQAVLGYCYETGLGITRDVAAAAKWYRLAIDKGMIEPAYALGLLLREEPGVSSDDNDSISWLTYAADDGYEPAIYELGMAYLHGLGIESDRQRGISYLQKAAELGFEPAQQLLDELGEK